jgi:hypothetical protein
MNHYLYILSFALLASLAACRPFENDIELDLDEYEPELFVECYLVPGEPYALLLSETQGYFDELNTLPFVNDATVVIEYNGVRDTLMPAAPFPGGGPVPFIPYFNSRFTKFYNYASSTICPLDTVGGVFKLYITDPKGRSLFGETSTLPPVPIEKLEARYNADSAAALLFSFYDNGAQANFYRVVMQEGSIDSLPFFAGTFEDANFFNGERIVIGTAFEFESGDTVHAALYHIREPYFKFMSTIEDAISSNGNPFAQPGYIESTVTGGLGVFSYMISDTTMLIIP